MNPHKATETSSQLAPAKWLLLVRGDFMNVNKFLFLLFIDETLIWQDKLKINEKFEKQKHCASLSSGKRISTRLAAQLISFDAITGDSNYTWRGDFRFFAL